MSHKVLTHEVNYRILYKIRTNEYIVTRHKNERSLWFLKIHELSLELLELNKHNSDGYGLNL